MSTGTKVLAVVVTAVFAFAIGSAKAGGNGTAAFEQLKSLSGHWETEKSNREKATLDLELTSGGTAIIERTHVTEEGKSVEMITLYYLDGEQLKMTHYCMAGNQPTMRGLYAPDTKTLTFEFEGATNLKNPNDGHMHHAVYTFIDSDHFKTAWTFRKDQKDAFTEDVTYVRAK
ncbi:MAG TPA: hypothetical protein VNH65_15450 [Candidatus Acidoferrum sp.]|nr:hypothetical protein [Candidatus Acidoferrum sp.]